VIAAACLVACGPENPQTQWCNAADDWMRTVLARDGISANFAKAPPCVVKETGDDDFRIVGHGYVTPLTERGAAQPYVWFSSVLKRHTEETLLVCGARLFFPEGEPEIIEGASCHVDLDAALASPPR
jgi:hypothetical protein